MERKITQNGWIKDRLMDRLYTQSTVNVKFSNFSSLGAAMKIDLQQFPNVYSNFLSNPLCFLLYENQDMPPLEWDPVRRYIYTAIFMYPLL